MASKPILGYWSTRCLAQHIRVMLAYGNIDYVDKRYVVTAGPEFNKEDWYKEKYSLDLDFPNLPYYLDEDVKITQTTAITRYVASKTKLLADTPVAQARCDMFYEHVRDHFMDFIDLCYTEWCDERKEQYLQDLPDKLQSLSKYLGQNRWVVGDKLTYADFWLHEFLDQQNTFHPGCLEDFANLKRFKRGFEEIPEVDAYRSHENYLERPFNNKYAKWY